MIKIVVYINITDGDDIQIRTESPCPADTTRHFLEFALNSLQSPDETFIIDLEKEKQN